jgi:hypothetical protein
MELPKFLEIGESETIIIPELKAFKLNKVGRTINVAVIEFKNIRKRIEPSNPYSKYCEMSHTKINRIIEVFPSVKEFKKANTNIYLQNSKHWKGEILKIINN